MNIVLARIYDCQKFCWGPLVPKYAVNNYFWNLCRIMTEDAKTSYILEEITIKYWHCLICKFDFKLIRLSEYRKYSFYLQIRSSKLISVSITCLYLNLSVNLEVLLYKMQKQTTEVLCKTKVFLKIEQISWEITSVRVQAWRPERL